MWAQGHFMFKEIFNFKVFTITVTLTQLVLSLVQLKYCGTSLKYKYKWVDQQIFQLIKNKHMRNILFSFFHIIGQGLRFLSSVI